MSALVPAVANPGCMYLAAAAGVLGTTRRRSRDEREHPRPVIVPYRSFVTTGLLSY
jgi:hypothetical protein